MTRRSGFALLLALTGVAACAGDSRPGALYPEDAEEAMASFEAPERDAWQQPYRVVATLGLARDAVVADIGAGSGYFSRRLARAVPEGKVVAVEIDADFDDHIRAKRESWGTPNIDPHLGFDDTPALPERSIDAALIVNTLAYIRPGDRGKYIKDLLRALRPGGVIAIVDFRPDAADAPESALAPEARLPRSGVTALMHEAGLQLKAEHTFLAHQYFLVFHR